MGCCFLLFLSAASVSSLQENAGASLLLVLLFNTVTQKVLLGKQELKYIFEILND